ncbi:MAG: hypothetical protein K9L95_01905 [Candidatus Omnitrophica bacterium]|nr:hypothetical protein [Candidatus Omnitrophota bacterium]MCF7876751.1 hypothetical protein [Candidatus Omnitrophota bacterium]MCF7878209.1 hypothetical protein [Candidatus Omnitrophota bacterium]MCF7892667.1 hypothetical protein [Candidatus Omnitrophota bacterium]
MKPEEKIISYFSALKQKKIIGPSYIFIGENLSLIGRLLKIINCQETSKYCGQCWSCKRLDDFKHPDLLVVEPEGVSIKINQIRQAIRFLSRSSYLAPKKILLVKDAQKLTAEAANLFLKTLEEPPNNSFIGLICPKLEDILPTIISRCRKIYLPYLENKAIKSEDDVEAILRSGYFGSQKRKDFSLFLESLIILLHKRLKSKISYAGQPGSGFLSSLDFKETITALENLFKIYQASGTVNINLAINLIKMGLKCS